MLTLTKQEFMRRRNANLREFRNNYLTEGNFRTQKYHGADCVAGTHGYEYIMNKSADIRAACYVGALPMLEELHGYDAVMYDDETDTLIPIELKLATISLSNFYLTRRNTLKYGSRDLKYPKNVECHAKARYSIRTPENLLSKRILTYLVVADSDLNQLVCSYMMDPDKIYSILSGSEGKEKRVTLASFIKNGFEVTSRKLSQFGSFARYKSYVHEKLLA